MISRKELENAINEYENKADSYNDCQRLATYYTIYDKLYNSHEDVGRYEYSEMPQPIEAVPENEIVGDYGDSEFLQTISGRDTAQAWAVIDELMTALKVIQPKLYDSVLRRITSKA